MVETLTRSQQLALRLIRLNILSGDAVSDQEARRLHDQACRVRGQLWHATLDSEGNPHVSELTTWAIHHIDLIDLID